MDTIPTRPAEPMDPVAASSGALMAMLAEYNSLRQESLSAITNRITVANFSFGAVAVVIAALITRQSVGVVEGVVALFLLPQVAKAGLLIWLGEYNRSQRAGKALGIIEDKINSHTNHTTKGAEAMVWENGLIRKGDHMIFPYLATIFLLLGAGWVSAGYGTYLVGRQFESTLANLSGPGFITSLDARALVLTVVVIEVAFTVFVWMKWREIRHAYKRGAPDVGERAA